MTKTSSYNRQQTIFGGDKPLNLIYSQLIRHNKNKLFLSLGDYELSFLQLKAILKLLHNHPYIQKVSLYNNHIDDEGAELIAELIIKNNIINCLILNDNIFTKLGANKIFTALESNKAITQISCVGCPTGIDIQINIDKKTANNSYLAKKISQFLFNNFQNSTDLENSAHYQGYFINYYQANKILINQILLDKATNHLKTLKSKKTHNIQKDFSDIKNNYPENTKFRIIWQASDKHFRDDGVATAASKLVTQIIANFEKCIINNFFYIKLVCKNIFNNEDENYLAKLPNELLINVMFFIEPKDIYYNSYQNSDQFKKYSIADRSPIIDLSEFFGCEEKDDESIEASVGLCNEFLG